MRKLHEYQQEILERPLSAPVPIDDLERRATVLRRRMFATRAVLLGTVLGCVVLASFSLTWRNNKDSTLAVATAPTATATSAPSSALTSTTWSHAVAEATGAFVVGWVPPGFEGDGKQPETTQLDGSIRRTQHFWVGSWTASTTSTLTISSVRGADAAASMKVLFADPSAQHASVRGKEAVIYRPQPVSGWTAVAWEETPDIAMFVAGRDLDQVKLAQVAESISAGQ